MSRSHTLLRPALAALALAIAVPAAAEGPPTEIEVIDDKPSSKRPPKPSLRLNLNALPDADLDNTVIHFPTGIRFIMQSDKTHPYVSVFMVVDHGAGDDPEGKMGTAHFVEHTWFRSVHDDRPPIMTHIQDLGTLFNATTRPDTTDFRTVASSEYLPELMKLESLRLANPYRGMTEDQVETEREVVRNEWRRRNEQGQNLVYDSLLRSVYPEGHPYHARETNESLDNIDLATLQGYFDEHYKPENTTVIVIGDFDPAEVRSLIFSNWDLSLLDPDLKLEHLIRYPKPGIENPDEDNPDHWLTDAVNPRDTEKPYPWPDPESFEPRVTPATPYPPLPSPPEYDELPTYKAAVDNQIVAVGWALPGGYRGQDFELQALGFTSSVYLGSELGRRGYLDTETDKNGLKDPSCFTQVTKIHSMMICAVEVTDKKRWKDPERVADLLIDQLPTLWNPEMRQVTNQFYSRAKLDQMASIFRSTDIVAQHFGGRAEAIGFHAHQTGSVKYFSDAITATSALDAANVANLGYEYLQRDRAAIAVIEPIPEEEIDTTAETSSYHGASEGDSVIKSADGTEGVSAEEIKDAYIKPDLDDLVDKRLPNGMRVVVLPHGESPLAQATLVFGGGTSIEPEGLFFMTENFQTSDWRVNDPLQIAATRTGARQTGIMGAYGSTAFTDGMQVPASNLDGALWMLREGMETLRPYTAGKPTYARKQLKKQGGRFHSRDWNLADMRARHLYPESPTEWPIQWSTIENWKDWGSSDIGDLQDRIYQPANTTLVIVGNVDKDQALRLAVDYFGGWEAEDGVEVGPYPAPEPPAMGSGTKILVFDDPKRTQTQVQYQCRMNTKGPESIQATAVLSNLVRDMTFRQLRVKEALAYSPAGFAYSRPDGAAELAFSSLAVNTGVGRTVEFFLDVAQRVEDGEISDDMLTRYKLRRARQHGIQAQSTDQMTSKLVSALAWQQPWSMLTDAGEDIANVNAAQLQEMVEGCSDRYIVTMQGPEEVIVPQLEEKGIPFEVVDYEARGDELHEKADPRGYKKYARKRAKAEKKKEEAEAEAETEDGSADGE